jgi:hypothetical protein
MPFVGAGYHGRAGPFPTDRAGRAQLRREWERLPPTHHACQCSLNELHTNDGLRAVAKGACGCPHLNSGGLRLDLVELLISKKKHLVAARAYLERAAGFGVSRQKGASLRRTLDRLISREARA